MENEIQLKNYQKFNSNVIKLIAIIAMTVDHVAWAIFRDFNTNPIAIVMHIIGRITCPIMCFFVAEGYHHTRNINKYTLRMFIFAFISHFPYVLASWNFVDWHSFIPFYYGSVFNQTSVMWSLAWGLVLLRIANSEKIKTWLKYILILLICAVSFPSDWSCIAALCVMFMGLNRGKFKIQMIWLVAMVAIYAIVYIFAIDLVYGFIQFGVILSVPILLLYNGQRGKNKTANKIIKWVYYIYYPLHLLIIGLLVLFL